MIKISIVIHVLAATIWTGGHLALVFMYLIPAFKTKSLKEILDFEHRYEKVGMPALVLLVITGFYQFYYFLPDLSLWFDFNNHISTHISSKVIMVIMIAILALDMKLRVFKQENPNFYDFAIHVFAVTALSVLLVIVGLSIRLDIF